MLTLLLACGSPDGTTVDLTLDPCETSGSVCTWMGVPEVGGFTDDGLSRLDTWLYLPVDLVFNADGTAYVPDFNNHRVRQVAPDGIVTTLSGTDTDLSSHTDCTAGCDLDALPFDYWRQPFDIAMDPVAPDTLWVFDQNWISRVDLALREVFTEVSGLGRSGGVVVDADGILYVSDAEKAVIWRVEGDVVTVLAGQQGVPGHSGDGGPAASALLGGGDGPSKIALDGRRLLLADSANHVVRAIDLDAGTIELVAGSTEGEPFVAPTDLAVGADGSLYVADPGSHCVFVVHPDGTVGSFAGVCATSGFAGDGGPAAAALFDEPYGVAVDAEGAVYVADTMNQVIRRVAP